MSHQHSLARAGPSRRERTLAFFARTLTASPISFSFALSVFSMLFLDSCMNLCRPACEPPVARLWQASSHPPDAPVARRRLLAAAGERLDLSEGESVKPPLALAAGEDLRRQRELLRGLAVLRLQLLHDLQRWTISRERARVGQGRTLRIASSGPDILSVWKEVDPGACARRLLNKTTNSDLPNSTLLPRFTSKAYRTL